MSRNRLRNFVVCWLASFLGSFAQAQAQDGTQQLSDYTQKLLSRLAKQEEAPPIKIEAFVSPRAPAKYVSTIQQLRRVLKALEKHGGGRVQVSLLEADAYSAAAAKAYSQHGIEPYPVQGAIPGIFPGVYVFCGAIISAGEETVRAPFLSPGDALEYRLVRAIEDVTKSSRAKKKLGVLTTDAQLMGGFSVAQRRPLPSYRIIEELKQFHNVVVVSPQDIDKAEVSALIIPQISSLQVESFPKVLEWIKSGKPTLIYEDPLPATTSVAGTADPRMMAGRLPGLGRPPKPKPDLAPLWKLLGIRFGADLVVWQDHVPAGIRARLQKEMLFISRDTPSRGWTLAKDQKITSSLNTLFFYAPGAIAPAEQDKSFHPLVLSSDASGVRRVADVRRVRGDNAKYSRSRSAYVIAARIDGSKAQSEERKKLNVIIVTDLDCLSDAMVQMRDQPSADIPIPLDNVAFVMNCVDSLLGNTEIIDLRGRRPTLPPPSDRERELASAIRRVENQFDEAGDRARQQAEISLKTLRTEMEKKVAKNPADRARLLTALQAQMSFAQKKLSVQLSRINRERERALAKTRTELREKLKLLPTK